MKEDIVKLCPTRRGILRYGVILTDEQVHGFCSSRPAWYRIRTIKYEDHIYYDKMVDGEVVEFKELI